MTAANHEHEPDRYSPCSECAALAATPPAEGLDVERRADGVVVGGPIGLHECPACRLPHDFGLDPVRLAAALKATGWADSGERRWSQKIAREYAALPPEQPQ